MSEDYYLNFLVVGDRHFTRDLTLSRIDNVYTAVVSDHVADLAEFIKQIIDEVKSELV